MLSAGTCRGLGAGKAQMTPNDPENASATQSSARHPDAGAYIPPLIQMIRRSPSSQEQSVAVAFTAVKPPDVEVFSASGVEAVLSYYLNDIELETEILSKLRRSRRALETESQQFGDGEIGARASATAPLTREPVPHVMAHVTESPAVDAQWVWIAPRPVGVNATQRSSEDREWLIVDDGNMTSPGEHGGMKSGREGVRALGATRPRNVDRYIDADQVPVRGERTRGAFNIRENVAGMGRAMSIRVVELWRSVPVKVALSFVLILLATWWHHVF